MRHKRYLIPAAIATCALPAAAGASAATATPSTAPTSHAALWEDPALNVICGVENPVLSKAKVLCQGPGVPRPPHSSTNEGDPAVTLASRGKPQLVLISQDSYKPGATASNLGAGRTWSARGVTCKTSAHTVRCQNAQKHGFTLRNHHYKAF
jgi:hypothetical protein